MRAAAFILICFSFGGWAVLGVAAAEPRYGLALCGALVLWAGLLTVWMKVRRVVSGEARPSRKRFTRLVDLVFSLAPGLVLVAYGAFAPAAPSLTRGGFDVCDASPGYCVSGVRAFVDLGICALIVGVITHWVIWLETKATPKDNQ